MTGAVEQIKAIIVSVAQALGVDPKLALATAQQESGFNPDAIGDSGHSVGLFQLNDRGEGAGMTVAQRQDPTVNARIALTQIGNVARDHPDWSPGEIAAAAQRPKDRAGYARSVNAIYGGTAAPSSSPTSSAVSSLGFPNPFDAIGAANDFIGGLNPANIGGDIVNGLFRLSVFATLLAAGAALVVLGGWRAVTQTQAYRSAKEATSSAAKVAAVAA